MEGSSNDIELKVSLHAPNINAAPQRKYCDKSTQTVRCRVRLLTPTTTEAAPSVAPSCVQEKIRKIYEDRLFYKWFFTPGQLSEDEIQELKVIVNNSAKCTDVVKDLVNKM